MAGSEPANQCRMNFEPPGWRARERERDLEVVVLRQPDGRRPRRNFFVVEKNLEGLGGQGLELRLRGGEFRPGNFSITVGVERKQWFNIGAGEGERGLDVVAVHFQFERAQSGIVGLGGNECEKRQQNDKTAPHEGRVVTKKREHGNLRSRYENVKGAFQFLRKPDSRPRIPLGLADGARVLQLKYAESDRVGLLLVVVF